MSLLFETASVRIGDRKIFLVDIHSFVEDKGGARVRLKNKQELSVTQDEKEIIHRALAFQKSVLQAGILPRSDVHNYAHNKRG